MKKINVEKTGSRGVVIAPAFIYTEVDLTPKDTIITENEIDTEIEKVSNAKVLVLKELEKISEINPVFNAHIEIASDYTLQEGIGGKIKGELKNAELATYETIEEIAAMFAAIDDDYMRERSADIKDVGKRFMSVLKNKKLPDLGEITKEVVVFAKDMYPSDTVKIDKKFIKGIVTEEGGITSHVFIIAKSMDIPILVGVKDILSNISENDCICMDAEVGEIVINPDESIMNQYEEHKNHYLVQKAKLELLRTQKIINKEGREISLCANVGNIADLKNALDVSVQDVGLFRSEFLYMESTHFPSEEEQFKVYKEAAEICTHEITIRTLDIGGDKELSNFDFGKEENPFLGWRAIRICLEMQDMFIEQIRAILRASAYGPIRIMIPMIISIEEILEVKKILEKCKQDLRLEGTAFNEKIELGMMIETPASVLLAEEFAKEVDFFSIGTNDLTQYLLAVDRGNKKIANLYNYFHPAVLKAIKHVITAGHEEGIKVGMCGEMAGDTKASKLLLEMGLDEFSMSASSIDYVRGVLLEKESN